MGVEHLEGSTLMTRCIWDLVNLQACLGFDVCPTIFCHSCRLFFGLVTLQNLSACVFVWLKLVVILFVPVAMAWVTHHPIDTNPNPHILKEPQDFKPIKEQKAQKTAQSAPRLGSDYLSWPCLLSSTRRKLNSGSPFSSFTTWNKCVPWPFSIPTTWSKCYVVSVPWLEKKFYCWS